MRIRLGITLNDRVLSRIDESRGDLPRSRVIEEILMDKLEIPRAIVAGPAGE